MKKRSFKSSKPFTKQQLKAIKTISQHSQELKKNVTTDSSASITETAPFTPSNALTIAQGDGDGERVGDKIKIKDIHWKVNLRSGTVNDVVRAYVVQFFNNSISGELAINPNEFHLDTDATDGLKYKILYDKTFQLNSVNQPSRQLDIKIKKPPMSLLEYDAGATTLDKGQINLVITTLNTTASQMTGSSSCKVRYYD